MSEQSDEEETGISGLQVVLSTLAAGFGVQSSKNRKRDFQQGKLRTFIIAGLVFTGLFIATVYFAVSMVLQHAR